MASVPVPTGWPELDAALPGGGWPRGVLNELFVERYGIGEIRLLLPVLVRVAREGHPQAWVAPPRVPYAPALAAAGFDLDRLLVVHPAAGVETDWAIEQCLRTTGCGAVLAWPARTGMRELRRLQLAATMGGACVFLFRHGAGRRQPSPAAVRMALSPHADGLALDLFKVRGGPPREVRLQW